MRELIGRINKVGLTWWRGIAEHEWRMREALHIKGVGFEYPVVFAQEGLPHDLVQLIQGRQVAIVTDEVVARIEWFHQFEMHVKGFSREYVKCVVPAGEVSKNLSSFASVCSDLARNRFSRKSILLAVGGGVVGD